MNELKILIVDDHKVVREGVKFILNSQDLFEVDIQESETVENAIRKTSVIDYDLVLMDINIDEESGIEATKQIVKLKPNINVLALSTHNEEHKIRGMINAGAKGYALKNSGSDELLRAIQLVSKGQNFYSNEVALMLIGKSKNETLKTDMQLSKRELEVLRLIGEEMTNEEIGVALNLSKRTVDSHRNKMLSKLGLKNTAGLIRYAMTHGLLD